MQPTSGRRVRPTSAMVGTSLIVLIGAAALAGQSGSPHDAGPAREDPVRIVLLGDVMLGRSVGPVVRNDPGSVFEYVRPILAQADVALANLESPLTTRAHVVGENALEANPSAAAMLAGAGLDGLALANNHAGDAGPGTVTDTLAALARNGLQAVGAGTDASAATTPVIFVRNGVRIAVLAFDLTGGGPPAGAGPGVATWDDERARGAIDAARADADVVIVGVHGGVEYLPRPDPVLRRVVDELTAWGVDVIWGTGSHVPYAVTFKRSSSGRASIQAPGLGNALFDQRIAGTQEGLVLEVLADSHGVIASRTGRVSTRLRSRFKGWDAPPGDAVALDGEWWSPARVVRPVATTAIPDDARGLPSAATLVVGGVGDVDGDGRDDVVASYRRPATPKMLHNAFPDVRFVDADGRTAHLAVFGQGGGLRWGAGTMLQPVAALAVCDGSVALGFSSLDDPTVIAGGAWRWSGFGFSTAPVLSGTAQPGCIDLDGDGHTEPLLIRPTALINGAQPS